MAPWTRASELHRALLCPASCVLPRNSSEPRGAAQLGTAIHAWVAGEDPTPQVAEWLARQSGTVRREGVADILLGMDTEGGPDVVVQADRETRNWVRASLPDSYVAGECDWAMLPEPHVKDLKTGWHPGRPRTLEQLAFYDLVLIRHAGTEDGYATIVHWPADGVQPPLETTERFEREELQEWWDETVIPASRLARGPNPPVIPGDHCRFCPCVTCPNNYEMNQGATE